MIMMYLEKKIHRWKEIVNIMDILIYFLSKEHVVHVLGVWKTKSFTTIHPLSIPLICHDHREVDINLS